ncbi:hydroxymethylglutaryl-CoA reductase, degradative [Liquorilactobacillus hordei]|uniref:3-hydroxy-3-methylglutaryl coenzyme A reductase n=1 Tax=Liquorilactobacillus hordei DSM 19519 TaxID=1423759 RepID=A0A0R1MEC9_9LACO|nr:hydroxymethylglutaryl-CoA reductase, degradative [Liquorilactobacillus hordei]KRL06446.1 3-hydroxy-3-methylglutaryl-coenzyme A reductase 3-hydroxy-3-methylglutaryl-coenzyme Auctase [Liquorilactobacillus hordei DSM 19519]QYH51847.1 hydroxymethylglutaryl-CoA reductase, degradative [Liquorilactobacillus hordei DSM 19519]
MQNYGKFYQKPWEERINLIKKNEKLTEKQIQILETAAQNKTLGNTMIENYITDYSYPEGIAFHYLINNKDYIVPMVTEEPSVVAASSHGASIIAKAGGFFASTSERLMIGQIIVENVEDTENLTKKIQKIGKELLLVADQAHPSLKRRGGGTRWLKTRILAADLVTIDIAIDVQEAMGANMINTMLEAVAKKLEELLNQQVLMSILSNYATECVARATCEIPVELLAKKGISGENIAKKISQASRVAQLDPYRAVTHNKGIMNGVDAVVMASGNDWRAIESGAHAYAARNGQYRGLSTWKLNNNCLIGELELPLPVGFVGGSIGIIPLVKVNQDLLKITSAQELECVIVSVGLAQNLAALLALVSEGIQKGHMRLQLKSLVIAAGADAIEEQTVVDKMLQAGKRDLESAKKILKEIRKRDKNAGS